MKKRNEFQPKVQQFKTSRNYDDAHLKVYINGVAESEYLFKISASFTLVKMFRHFAVLCEVCLNQ